MSKVLAGVEGVLCLIDDVLMFGKDEEEDNKRLTVALGSIPATGAKFNPDKCEFVSQLYNNSTRSTLCFCCSLFVSIICSLFVSIFCLCEVLVLDNSKAFYWSRHQYTIC